MTVSTELKNCTTELPQRSPVFYLSETDTWYLNQSTEEFHQDYISTRNEIARFQVPST